MATPARPVIAFFLTFLILTPNEKIYGSTYTWTGAISDDWAIRGNWVGDTSDLSPPTSTDDVLIGMNGTAEVPTTGLYDTLNLGVGSLIAEPGHVLVTTGELVGNNTNVGVFSLPSSNFSTVTVDGGIWNNIENINIGVLSNGKVTINGGQTNADSVNVGVGAVGHLILNGGMLSTNSVKGSPEAIFTFNGGVLQATHDDPNFISKFTNGTLTSLSNDSTIDTQNFKVGITSAISGSGGLTVTGNSGVVTLSKANSYTGVTTLTSFGNGITLAQGATDTLSPDSNVSIGANCKLDLAGKAATIGSLSGVAGSIVTTSENSATLRLGNTNSSAIFDGSLINGEGSAILSITKTGSGTQTFKSSGINLYSGITTISDGTITQGATNALSPNSNYVISATGKIDMNGFNGIIGSLNGSLGAIVTNSGIGNAIISVGFTSNDGNFSGNIKDGNIGKIGFTKLGLGIQDLSGANTYSGLTTILGGTLLQGAKNALSARSNISIGSFGILDIGGFDGTIGILMGNIGAEVTNSGISDAVLSVGFTNDSGIYAGILQNGTKQLALTKVGLGTQILSGANTYSGLTSILGGTLAQGATNALSSLSNVFIGSFGTLNLGGFNSTIGALTGDLGAQVTNNGISDAVLTVGFTNESGTYAGILQNGTKQLALTKVGIGTQILSGANTYSGLTHIAQGAWKQGLENALSPFSNHHIKSSAILDINGFNATIGILTGEEGSIVTNNGLVAASLNVGSTGKSGVFAGILQGPMAINKIGNGSWTLLGPNTYTGGTTVTAGTLIGTTTSLQGIIQNKGTLSFYQSFLGTFLGTISDSGSVNIHTPRGIIFNTPQTYTGDTTIQGGALLVNTTLASKNVFVNAGSFLGGLAILNGNVFNTGTISPGTRGVGNMTIKNHYTQSPAATFRTVFNDILNYGRLFVGGIAQLAGRLQVVLPNGFPDTTTTVPIVTAGERVSGIFNQVEAIPGVKVIYDPQNALLVVSSGFEAVEESVSTTDGSSSTNNSSINNNSSANNSGWIGGDLAPAIIVTGIIGVPVEELLPTLAGTIKEIIFNTTNTQYGQLVTRLAAIRAGVGNFCFQGLSQEPMIEQLSRRDSKIVNKASKLEHSRWDIFAFASGIYSKMNSVCDLPRSNAITGYFSAGTNYCINECLNIGIYAGYQGIKGWDADGSWMKSNGTKYGIFGTARWKGFSQFNHLSQSQEIFPWEDNFYINALVGGGANFFHLYRSIDVKKYHWAARSNPFGVELDSLLGSGYEFNIGLWRFGANTSIQYTYLGIPSFDETGARNLNAKINRQSFSSLVYTLGANVSYLWTIAPHYKIFPTVGLYWQHEFLNYEQRINGSFRNGSGAAFNFSSPAGFRNNAFGVAGINAQIGCVGIYGYYTPQFDGHSFTSHGVMIGLNYTF